VFNWPHPDMQEEYESGFYATGATEPWIAQILYSLIVAKQEPVSILETGCYVGTTTAWLAKAAIEVDGKLIYGDIDADRAFATYGRLDRYGLCHAVEDPHFNFWPQVDALDMIDMQGRGSLGFAWVDDDHQKEHVAAELAALMPKMAPGGIIAMHDVFGVCDLAGLCRQFGGLALDFPRIGPGGGLGLIQV